MGIQAGGERDPRGAFEPEKMYEGKATSSHFFRLHRTTEAVTPTFPKPSCLAQTTTLYSSGPAHPRQAAASFWEWTFMGSATKNPVSVFP